MANIGEPIPKTPLLTLNSLSLPENIKGFSVSGFQIMDCVGKGP